MLFIVPTRCFVLIEAAPFVMYLVLMGCFLRKSCAENKKRRGKGLWAIDKGIDAALFQTSIESISFFKSTSWNIVYYAVLLYGAIIALDKTFLHLVPYKKIFLALLSLVVCFAGFFLTLRHQFSLQKERYGVTAHKDIFEKTLYYLDSPEKKRRQEQKYSFFFYDPVMLVIFSLTVYLGFLITAFVLLFDP